MPDTTTSVERGAFGVVVAAAVAVVLAVAGVVYWRRRAANAGAKIRSDATPVAVARRADDTHETRGAPTPPAPSKVYRLIRKNIES